MESQTGGDSSQIRASGGMDPKPDLANSLSSLLPEREKDSLLINELCSLFQCKEEDLLRFIHY